jgi:peptidoglycan/LPS O-acetylase OafA/YrhL
MRYRADIDGLRALAVLPVVLFHAGLSFVTGGFVGVDVFFVISGYLITGILAEEYVSRGRISLLGFYERRIRRIFPALFAMIALCVWVTYELFDPEALIRFAQSAAWAALSASNIFFYLNLDYFGGGAEAEPLLHTWSLGVEEQYYILLPLLLIVTLKRSPGRAKLAVVLLALASFAVSLLLTRADPEANFYLLPSRAWELLLGSCLALGIFPRAKGQRLREAACALGVAMILAAVFLYGRATPFPGLSALLPCVGAALVIWAGMEQADSRTARILRLPPIVFIGRISYSLYLWHWPLIVFPTLWLGREMSHLESGGAALAALLAATLSWRFIEQPFRRRGRWPGRVSLYFGALLAMSLCLFHSIRTSEFEGYPKRLPAGYADLDISGPEFYSMDACLQNKRQSAEFWRFEDCVIPGEGEGHGLLWGDSFLGHYRPGLTQRDAPLPVSLVEHTKVACPPALTFDLPSNPTCREYNNSLVEMIEAGRFRLVILGADWVTALEEGYELDELSRTVDWLQALGLPVIVIGQSPTFAGRVAALHAWGNMGERRREEAVSVDPPDLNRKLREAAGKALFLDPRPLFCEGEVCRFGEGSRLYFWDRGHYTLFGSKRATEELLLPAIEEALRQP